MDCRDIIRLIASMDYNIGRLCYQTCRRWRDWCADLSYPVCRVENIDGFVITLTCQRLISGRFHGVYTRTLKHSLYVGMQDFCQVDVYRGQKHGCEYIFDWIIGWSKTIWNFNRPVKRITSSAEKLIIENFQEGQKHGWSLVYKYNKLISKINYDKGLRHGLCVTPGSVAFYIHGQKHGSYQRWHNQGWGNSLSIQANYVLGLRHGPYRKYHISGNVIRDNHYYYGAWHGPQYYYYPNGELAKVAHYHYGVPHGKHLTYDCRGKILHQRSYNYGQLVNDYITVRQGRVLEHWDIAAGHCHHYIKNGKMSQ